MNVDKDQLNAGDWWKVQGLEHVGTMLSCVCDAISNAQAEQTAVLERIATALERAHPKQLVDLTCGELFEGVTFSSEAFHEYDGTGETLHSYVRLALDDMGLGFDVRSINDEPAECYGDATAEWHFQSPDELHALADAFRTRYAYLIDMVASEWAKRIADGTIPAREA